ncbi:hypothetical protein BC835DRAFT_1311402 [Cytidiella melzeri]|nr:hypothetical protein BC835DRAFT_1311402 [Cytidiella melzeri]
MIKNTIKYRALVNTESIKITLMLVPAHDYEVCSDEAGVGEWESSFIACFDMWNCAAIQWKDYWNWDFSQCWFGSFVNGTSQAVLSYIAVGLVCYSVVVALSYIPVFGSFACVAT